MPKGEKRRGGRQKGTPNKSANSIRQLAVEFGPLALETVVNIVKRKSNPANVRIAAAKEILDRAYGRPTQTISGDPDQPIVHDIIVRFLDPNYKI